jgi:hypothetical protein
MSMAKRAKSEIKHDFPLILPAGVPTHWPPTMGQQSKKIIKRRRRADYVKRKAEQAKLGGTVKSSAVKKADPAKKAPAKKVAAKKAPAKKAAKKSPELEDAQVAAAEPVEATEAAVEVATADPAEEA